MPIVTARAHRRTARRYSQTRPFFGAHNLTESFTYWPTLGGYMSITRIDYGNGSKPYVKRRFIRSDFGLNLALAMLFKPMRPICRA